MARWSDKAFLARLEARAAEIGQPLHKLLADAGVGLGHDTLDKNVSTRKISTLERVGDALGMSLAQIMGFAEEIDLGISERAFTEAEMVLSRLPRGMQTRANLVLAHKHFYELIADRHRVGEEAGDETIRAWAEMLLRAWVGTGAGGSEKG